MPDDKLTLRNVFTLQEIHDTRFLDKAIANAEHRHYVRARIGKGNPGEQMLRHQKYGKILGVFGYDQLPLKPLARLEGPDRQAGVKAAMPDSVNTAALFRDASMELEKGIQVNDAAGLSRVDKLKIEIQEVQHSPSELKSAQFKDALESVIHPIPHVEPPKLTQKSLNTINRRRLYLQNAAKKYHTLGSSIYNKISPLQSNFSKKKYREHVVEVIDDLDNIMSEHKDKDDADSDMDGSDEDDLPPGKRPLLQHPEFIGPDDFISRPFQSRVSQRVPKGFITLSAEPAAAVSEFGSEVDSKLINSLDEKLSRFKEVEELYDEIMKTLNGFHLETSDESNDFCGCLAAPYDPKIPLSPAFQGLVIPAFTPNTQAKVNQAMEEEALRANEDFNRASSPTIRMRTRDRQLVTVTPDEFINDREAAMRKTLSSRYNTFKYNFGGYIPYDIDKKRKKMVEAFNTADYIEFLRTRTCDFIMDLLIDREKDEEDMRRMLEEQERIRSSEEEKRRIMELKEQNLERIRRLTEFKDGVWNAGTLEYMEEIQEQEKRKQRHSSLTGIIRQSTPLEKIEGEDEKQDDNLAIEPPTMTKMISFAQEEENLNIIEAQKHLEELWVTLKMPVDQKLDMAIKYGSPKFAQKLKTAIELWETARNYIIDRENLLKEIEKFEVVASDPQRFFRKGYEGSSELRMIESKTREEFLRKLHYLEARLYDVTSLIKYELNETVTYKASLIPGKGVPYLEKIKHDYGNMIRSIQHAKALEAADGNTMPTVPISPSSSDSESSREKKKKAKKHKKRKKMKTDEKDKKKKKKKEKKKKAKSDKGQSSARKQKKKRAVRQNSNVFAMFDSAQIAEFKEAFSMFDHDSDGFVDKEDLKDMLASLGQNPTDEYIDDMISEAPGSINFTMFLTLMGEKLSGTDPEHEILQAFECFDEAKTGFINADVLREYMTTMGDRFTDEEVDIMFKGAPLDRNNNFNYKDFVRVIKHGE
ncbi:Myosin regulatory light chain 12B [Phlyctochytrium bullatum]|nr:Myosin regulatory light chain 12B [Phlyctochytrium bullatum]